MDFRETARRMISDWYKNKKRAGSNSPKNDADKSPEQKMEAVIESIVTNPSLGDHFAYFSASPLCGSCGLAMRREIVDNEPGKDFRFQVRCPNESCRHGGILYEVVPEKSAVIVMRRVDEKKTE